LFDLMETLVPLTRAARNLHRALQTAREAIKSDPFIIEMRDQAYEVDNARIGTIHGFCGDVLRESALRSGRSPGFEVLEEGEGGAEATPET